MFFLMVKAQVIKPWIDLIRALGFEVQVLIATLLEIQSLFPEHIQIKR